MATAKPAPEPVAAPRRRWLRRRNVFAGVLTLLLLIALLYARIPFGPRLKTENVDEIRDGMTQAEVEALLGGPPGYYRHPPVRVYNLVFSVHPGVTGGYDPLPEQTKRIRALQQARQKFWVGDLLVQVVFDERGRVIYCDKSRPPLGTSRDDWIRYYRDWPPMPGEFFAGLLRYYFP